MTTSALPPVVDADTWQRQLDELRVREKAATRELDAIAAQRRRLPMVKMPDYSAQSLERSSHGFRGGLRVDLTWSRRSGRWRRIRTTSPGVYVKVD